MFLFIMNFINTFIDVLKNKYATFSGRARRAEYWQYIAVYCVAYIILSIVDVLLAKLLGFRILASLFSLAMLVPTLAVTVRRMHDVSKPGWFLIIPIYNIILALTPGVIGDNQYGKDPKAIE